MTLTPPISAADRPAHLVTAAFTDTGATLVNPGMGFVLFYYSNRPDQYGANLDATDTLDEFPGLSTVYLRLPWGLLEPEEGKFDWSWLDAPAQRWIAKGKRVALRLTTSENFMRYATPKWVYDAGAKSVPMVAKYRDMHTGEPSLDPKYDDPIYLAKLEQFLIAAAARYDGDPNIEFIDVGTLGMWGEGHTWQASRTHYPYPALFKHLELHTRHFTRSRLIVNDNHLDQDYGTPELMQHCLAHRMGIRNDSLGCFPGSPGYRCVTREIMQAFWLTAPTIIETTHYGHSVKAQCWNRDVLLQAVRDLHASYFSIHWWPREYLEKERPLIDQVNRILGYRLMIEHASWPAQARMDQPWNFSAKWSNTGVAPLYQDTYPALTLKDSQGGIAAVFVNENTNLRRVLPHPMGTSSPNRYLQNSVLGSRSFIKPGHYEIYLSAGSRTGTPQLAMPMPHEDGQRRYRLGAMEVIPGHATPW